MKAVVWWYKIRYKCFEGENEIVQNNGKWEIIHDREAKTDAELQGKEYVSEMKMHTEFKKWNTSMRWKEKHNEMCKLRINCKNTTHSKNIYNKRETWKKKRDYKEMGDKERPRLVHMKLLKNTNKYSEAEKCNISNA